MKIMTLASRNIARNWRRSLVTILAMAFACTIMIVYGALMKGIVAGSERQAVVMNYADIQMHQYGYRDDPDIYTVMTDADALLESIRNAGFHAAPRRFGFGLVASEGNSSGVQLRGIDLDAESRVTEINQHVMDGQWLDDTDPYGVVIGKKLARLLDASVGSELVFLGQGADGMMANDIFIVRGVLKSVASNIDSAGVFLPSQTLVELLSLSGGIHEIVVMRSDRQADLDAARQQIQQLAPHYETLDWRTLNPVVARFLESADVQTSIMMVFTYIAVATVVLNAILMSVFERVHEFGIMKAIGVTPGQSVALIFAESMLQTLIAAILGLGFGWWASNYLQTHGLDMSGFSGDLSFAGIALDPVWYTRITSQVLADPIFFLVLVSALAAVYPALKVARINVVDAIHYQ